MLLHRYFWLTDKPTLLAIKCNSMPMKTASQYTVGIYVCCFSGILSIAAKCRDHKPTMATTWKCHPSANKSPSQES